MEKPAKTLFLSVIISCNVVGQNTTPEYIPPSDYISMGQFDALLDSVPSTMGEDFRNQTLGSYNTFLGRADLNATLERLPSGKACIANEAIEQSGRAWLLDHATDARIIMFNENHLTLASRTFVRSHLKELRAQGFTHIGFEALAPFEGEKNAEQLIAAGYYTIEPMFSALIREAVGLGFNLFGYEYTGTQQPQASREERVVAREAGQAANIITVISSSPPDSKFIIYAGWSHIAEVPLPTAEPDVKLRWMASVLKEQTEIDPLTIDLTQCFYISNESEEWIGKIYISGDGSPLIQGSYTGAVDAQIYLPVPPPQTPDAANYYRKALGKPFQIPDKLLSNEHSVLVQAHFVGDANSTTAYDRVLLRPGEDLPLYLKSGDYEVTSYKGDGGVVGKEIVHIE